MNRLTIQDKCADLLAIFSSKLNILSSNNEYSWNSLAENIFLPLLNRVLDCNLSNENINEAKNVPAIDLVDYNKKVAVQITSSSSFSKVKRTLELFIDYNLDIKISEIYIFILKDKKGFIISSNQEEQINNIVQN